MASLAVLASLCVYFIGPFAIKLIFGPAFAPAADILRVFALLPIIIIFSNIFGVQTMLPLGMESAFSRVLLCAAIFDFAVFIPAAYLFGGIGAAWANIAVELFVSLTMAVLLHLDGRNPITFNLNKIASQ
jgi:PST family polysaccharide transporter